MAVPDGMTAAAGDAETIGGGVGTDHACLTEVAANVSAVLWLTSADFSRLLYVSPACERIWGRSAAELCADASSWFASIHPDDVPRLAEQARHATKLFDESYRVIHPSGALRWVRSRAYPVRDAAGAVIRYAGLTEDITTYKQVEQELDEVRSDVVDARRIKTEFVANVSHELRTPINGILGMAQLLRGTRQSAEQQEYTDNILGCAEQLLVLVTDMLDFSKLEANRIVLAEEPFSLRELLAGAVGLVGHAATQKGIVLTWAVDDDVPDALRGDPARVRQVVLNLLSNAVKFTDVGKVGLRVGGETVGPEHATLRIAVSDTGIGIPFEKQDAIFEPFVQADGTTTRRHGGTGLGLAVCVRLLQLMSGALRVESEPGKGSTFHCTLRLARAAETRPALDRRQLVDQIGEETAILGQLIAVFREEARMLREEIGHALAERNARALERAAHRLRGSLGTLAAGPAQDVALRLELLGRSGDLAAAADHFRALEQELSRLEPELVALDDSAGAG